MKKLFIIALGATAAVSLLSSSAFAAPRATNSLGNDISWPQCGKTLPTNQAFGIVGVNGGKATTDNPCLVTQLQWANRSTGTTNQPPVQLYVNTANPGEVLEQYNITTWPTNNIDSQGFETLNNADPAYNNPYGACTTTPGNYNGYTNDLPCSWQYGWNRAVQDVVERFGAAAQTAGMDSNAANYPWWLDVETMNSWQTNSPDFKAKNAATLEGMTAYFRTQGITVGLYSTGYQWGQIAGIHTGMTKNLAGLSSWLAGARSLKGAKSNCALAPLTVGGQVVLTQYVSGGLDYDYSCKG